MATFDRSSLSTIDPSLDNQINDGATDDLIMSDEDNQDVSDLDLSSKSVEKKNHPR